MSGAARRVPTRYFLLMRNALLSSGVDTSQILALARIDEDEFNARDGTLSPAEVDAFIAAARVVTGRDDLGFDLGRRIKSNSHDVLGYGLLSCSSIDEMLRMASRHYHLIVETWAMTYRRWHAGGEVVYTPTIAMPAETLRFYLETLAVTHHNQLRLLLGPQIPGYDLYLSMAKPAHAARYLALQPARFHFQEGALPMVRVVMGAELLDVPLALGDPEVARQIDERCSAMGQRPPRGEVGWGEFVTMVLREARGEQVTLEDLARRLKVSARTIDRALKKEGLGFRALSDKVRFERACDMLSVAGTSITEVALQLGFSDTANFSRAFRRVVGTTPGEHQRNATRPKREQDQGFYRVGTN
jgi:AraC-like DNA-binding protein